MEKEVINVLSIDGGGIRGLLPAEVLIYVENKLKELYENEDFKLADHFDYMAGTSTGGILTSLYVIPDGKGRPKYSAEDAANLYFNHGSKIFKKSFRYYLTFSGIFSYRYSSEYIENVFEKYFEDVRIADAVIPFMVTSVDTNARDLYLFKSYKAKKYPEHNRFFKEAVRATSAASTYFKPLQMIMEDGTEKSLVDGGFSINNPSISAYIEVLKLFPNAKKINILSISTGPDERSYPYKKARKWGVLNGANKLFNLVLTSMSDATQYQISKLYADEKINGEFLRIDPKTYDAKSKMDLASKKNLGLLKEAGQRSADEYKDQIDEFLKKTINKH